jgi:dihydrofolate synthase / folylpolyglutamate synthase
VNLREALAYLDAHINMETGGAVNVAPSEPRGTDLAPAVAAGRRFDPPSLQRMVSLLSFLGSPQLDLDVLHITGTNGKGSTARMASSLLGTSGLLVGMYTSPHLERVNERVVLAGKQITDADLAAVIDVVSNAERAGVVRCSWFELVTAAMFRWFSDEAVEAAVVEVGAGGRWDATNTADGRVAVITNVELDHMEWLGSTREEIAEEKVGLVKPGAVAVVGESAGVVGDLLERRALELGAASVLRRDRDFACVGNRFALGGRVVTIRTPRATYDDVFIPLHGTYQGDNAAIALVAAEQFLDDLVPTEVVNDAFAAVENPGRMEIVGRKPLVIVDGAHNPAGARAACATILEEFAAVEQWVVVLGLLRGRSPEQMLAAFPVERIRHLVVVAPPSPRALDPREIVLAAEALSLKATVAPDVARAVEVGRDLTQPNDLLLVTGSLYLVGAARPLLRTT